MTLFDLLLEHVASLGNKVHDPCHSILYYSFYYDSIVVQLCFHQNSKRVQMYKRAIGDWPASWSIRCKISQYSHFILCQSVLATRATTDSYLSEVQIMHLHKLLGGVITELQQFQLELQQ